VEHQDTLIATIRWQQRGFSRLGCPFYGALSEELIADVEAGGPAGELLAPFAAEPVESAYVLRLFAGLHRLVLRGAVPALTGHHPSAGGDGDARGAMEVIREVLRDPPPEVLGYLSRPPQTNEAAYWYEQDGTGWGNPSSPVRFTGLWPRASSLFAVCPEVLDRRGCDRHPIDVTTGAGAVTLLSYVWPEPAERFIRARDAIALARGRPAAIDRADADAWLEEQLRTQMRGAAFVVYHSVVWQYLGQIAQERIHALLVAAGSSATRQMPLARLRLEPHRQTYVPAELRLTLWDGHAGGPAEWLLATTDFHGGPLHWLAG
jgi:hypothetical protein